MGFTLAGNKLLYKGRVVLPKYSTFVSKLYKYHEALVGDHVGEVETYLRMAAE